MIISRSRCLRRGAFIKVSIGMWMVVSRSSGLVNPDGPCDLCRLRARV